ncbi:hypothetical protein [Mesorhizobium sp. CO1-1-4]|uniref:hypothetical protein n=1 Tax=Mesorhizobium sp. CO1-1-4 TaxID=2876633 RepID=UPI001CCAED67|nr:hypothetical protein [Mesorhizobium sp. CO1-1-4]MBZ9739640.1 hypothetical protein [Mesorhizobium sp. CO1-1-4]
MTPQEKRLETIAKFLQGLDAKISAVAAYIAAMPGGSKVDIANVRRLLDTNKWSPHAPFSPPSTSIMTSTVIGAIHNAASTKPVD